jgi:hypothetical protein
MNRTTLFLGIGALVLAGGIAACAFEQDSNPAPVAVAEHSDRATADALVLDNSADTLADSLAELQSRGDPPEVIAAVNSKITSLREQAAAVRAGAGR